MVRGQTPIRRAKSQGPNAQVHCGPTLKAGMRRDWTSAHACGSSFVRLLTETASGLLQTVRRLGRESRALRTLLTSKLSLVFAEDVILLASLGGGVQLALEWFTTECEAVRMNFTFKPEAMTLSW